MIDRPTETTVAEHVNQEAIVFRINPIATLRRAAIALVVLAAVGPASAGAATVE